MGAPRRFSDKMRYRFLRGELIQDLAAEYNMPWEDMRDLIFRASKHRKKYRHENNQ